MSNMKPKTYKEVLQTKSEIQGQIEALADNPGFKALLNKLQKNRKSQKLFDENPITMAYSVGRHDLLTEICIEVGVPNV